MAVAKEVVAERDGREQARDEEFAGVVLPPVREARGERQDRDRREQEGERQHGGYRRCCDGVTLRDGGVAVRGRIVVVSVGRL